MLISRNRFDHRSTPLRSPRSLRACIASKGSVRLGIPTKAAGKELCKKWWNTTSTRPNLVSRFSHELLCCRAPNCRYSQHPLDVFSCIAVIASIFTNQINGFVLQITYWVCEYLKSFKTASILCLKLGFNVKSLCKQAIYLAVQCKTYKHCDLCIIWQVGTKEASV